ncbi:uncharacterized protein LOC127718031 [Mytilus californianus]|uniref:uncharacterized protein LOC127718031 n=1 Tax=Mytilus californianus TaxID=6549 RepID=UPI0022486514|nr:uncharacterized protein LOC127718031 [Mytilus californianus]
MATYESALFCDVCQNRNLNKSAEAYCSQCEEALCIECRDHHKISRSSKSHQTISVEKHQKLPSFIKQIKHYCAKHDCFLEFYCKSHDSLCCKLCLISGHKECKETMFIEDFLMPSSGHQSAALDNIEKVLKDLDDNICSAIKDRTRNTTELRDQKQMIAEQIKEKRQEINTMLDHLEGALQKKASAMEKEYSRKINEVIAKLEAEKKKVNKIQKDFDSVKMFASNLQIIIGVKAFQESVSVNETNVQSLYNDGSLNNVAIECTFNENVERFIKEIKTFGDIKVNKCEKHSSFSWKCDTSAQIFKTVPKAILIDNISARLVRKISTQHFNLSGCAISENEDFFFLQLHKNNLLKYGPNGEFHSKSRINSGQYNVGYDLAMVDSNSVAVSCGGNNPKQLYIIDTNSTETRHVFDLCDWCYGLNYHNGSFICCTSANGIKLYDTLFHKLTNMRILPNAPNMVDGTYVTSNENSIFHSNCRNNSVVCYNFSGQVQWTYSDSLLTKPYGITLDSYSNIYVAGSESNNVVVISKDGKQAKQLIGSSDGILNPRAVFFHKTKNVLLVANYDGVAFLFDV